MKRQFAAIMFLGLVTIMSMSVQASPTFSEFIKNKNTTYQVIFSEESKIFAGFKVAKCVEGLVRNDFKQHPDAQFSNMGTLEAREQRGTPELIGRISITANANGTVDLQMLSIYIPVPDQSGHPLGQSTYMYGANLSTLGMLGKLESIREDGVGYRDYSNSRYDDQKMYSVEINLNPITNCSYRSK